MNKNEQRKVRELANKIGNPKLTNYEIETTLTKWLEQNQPAPVVVGLSDEQVKNFAMFFQPRNAERCVDSYKQWEKQQTFTQREVKKIVVGLSDSQIKRLTTHFICEKPDVDSPAECHAVITKFLDRELFEIPIVRHDIVRHIDKLEKEIEQLKSQQLKPSWDDAPDWANWLAQDIYGEWCWYEVKPEDIVRGRWMRKSGMYENVEINKNWQQTLEQRPEKIHKVVDWGCKWSKILPEVIEEKAVETSPPKPDWSKIPEHINQIHRREFYIKELTGQQIILSEVRFERPKPPAPKVEVEVGQVWRYIKDGIKVLTFGVFDGMVRVKIFDDKYIEYTLPDFLAKFDRVS